MMLRYLRTIRHLRARQILAQAAKLASGALRKSGSLNTRKAPEFPGCRWRQICDFLPPGRQANTLDELVAGRMTFLNESFDVGFPPAWEGGDASRLWRYNLHYFEYLWALDYSKGREIAADWIKSHAPRRTNVGWEPYPISLRVQNWCAYFFGLHRESTQSDPEFRRLLWTSIFVQTEWMSRHLEWRLMGNHLLENAATLVLAGTCFKGKVAHRWKRIGTRLLDAQLSQQILPDGMHFERSPMYHLRAAYVVATLLNIADEDLAGRLKPILLRMIDAMWKCCHVDGEIALFNDSALGVYNRPAELADYARNLGLDASVAPADVNADISLRYAGYYGARCEGGAYVLCDVGPIGPDYAPGHAHGDILSFEMSLDGRRVIVDSGNYDYTDSEMRKYCRSTRAHNTVEIDGQDQCEFWSVFRVARRPKPGKVEWARRGEGFSLTAQHDGYSRLRSGATHGRRFRFYPPGILMFKDTVRSRRDVTAACFLHLHPDCEITAIEGQNVEVAYPCGKFRIRFAGGGKLTQAESFYCCEFGKKIPNQALVFTGRGREMQFACCIAKAESDIDLDLSAGAVIDSTRYRW